MARAKQNPHDRKAAKVLNALQDGPIADMNRAISSMTDDELEATAARLRGQTSTNCGWLIYAAGPFLLDLVRQEQHERAQARQRMADRLGY